MRRMFIVLITVILFLMVPLVSATHSGGLLSNDGFENGTTFPPASWTGTGACTASIQTTGAPEGNNYLRQSLTNQNCGVFQDLVPFTSLPGTFSFYARITSTNCVLGTGTCLAEAHLEFYSDLSTLDVIIMIANHPGGCTQVPWNGNIGTQCRVIQAPCYNAVTANFCQYSDSDLTTSLENFCGSACVHKIMGEPHPVIFASKDNDAAGVGVSAVFDYDAMILKARIPAPTPGSIIAASMIGGMFALFAFDMFWRAFTSGGMPEKRFKAWLNFFIMVGLVILVLVTRGL